MASTTFSRCFVHFLELDDVDGIFLLEQLGHAHVEQLVGLDFELVHLAGDFLDAFMGPQVTDRLFHLRGYFHDDVRELPYIRGHLPYLVDFDLARDAVQYVERGGQR